MRCVNLSKTAVARYVNLSKRQTTSILSAFSATSARPRCQREYGSDELSEFWQKRRLLMVLLLVLVSRRIGSVRRGGAYQRYTPLFFYFSYNYCSFSGSKPSIRALNHQADNFTTNTLSTPGSHTVLVYVQNRVYVVQ